MVNGDFFGVRFDMDGILHGHYGFDSDFPNLTLDYDHTALNYDEDDPVRV